MKIPGPHDGQVFLVWVTLPLPEIKKGNTINSVEGEGGTWGFFMDVFVFLLAGVDFLLLFLLTSVKI